LKDRKAPNEFDFPYNEQYHDLILYYKQMLDLFAKLCIGGNQEAIKIISEGNTEHPPLITAPQALALAKNENLPGSVRALYGDLLFIWVDQDLPLKPHSVKYTWAWDELEEDYDAVAHRDPYPHLKKDSWLYKAAAELKDFILDDILAKSGSMKAMNTEYNLLLASVSSYYVNSYIL
jgi:hypothetical protein